MNEHRRSFLAALVGIVLFSAGVLLALVSAPGSPSDWGYYCFYNNWEIPIYSTTPVAWHIEQRFAVESSGVIQVYDCWPYMQVDPAADYSWGYGLFHG